MKNDTDEKPVQKPKTSLLAIASLVLAILSLLLPLITIIAIILAIGSIFAIRKNTGRLKGKGFITGAMITSVVSIALWTMALMAWSLDADPIPNDYTISDLRSAPLECNQTYELLLSLSEKESKDESKMADFIEEINTIIAESNEPNKIEALNAWAQKKLKQKPSPAPDIGLSGDDIKTINEFDKVIRDDNYPKIIEYLKSDTDKISQAWENAQKGRDIIKEINKFPEIADLSEPSLENKLSFLANLRLLTRLYRMYAYLQTEQGNSQNVVSELTEINSVCRKLNINSRGISAKLTCLGCLAININTANFIVNSTNTSQESVEFLAKHFASFTQEQSSMRNSLISEYLMFKNTLDTQNIKFYSLPETPFLKRNSTLRLFHNFCENWISAEYNSVESKKTELSVWPSTYLDWLPVSIDSQGKVPLAYTVYNPIGSLLLCLLTPAMEHVVEIKTKYEVHCDLFQIILNKRLGKEINLKARAYSDEYIIDIENKKIFSPGPDGIPHNDDDIKLIINPEVLNFTD